MTTKDVTFLIVHYNTPDLLEEALKSIRRFYKNHPIYIVDGCDFGPFNYRTRKMVESYGSLVLDCLGYNIHHGPGIAYGMKAIQTPYTFVLDSDAVLIGAPVGKMVEAIGPETYAVGEQVSVMDDGQNGGHIPYIHPAAMLLQRSTFFSYPAPIRHGAPMISTMKAIYSAGLSGAVLKPFDIKPFVEHAFMGTVGRFGWNF